MWWLVVVEDQTREKEMITHGASVRYVAGCIHLIITQNIALLLILIKPETVPKVAIVEHFLAVCVKRPVVSLARVVFIAWYLNG